MTIIKLWCYFHGERRDIRDYPSSKSFKRFSVISSNYELISQLRKQLFDALSSFAKRPAEWLRIQLIFASCSRQ